MKKTANKQVICQVLMEAAKTDRNIVALCSDSRGSGSFGPFADAFPEQFVETGIAEQNLVSIAAGLARCGKKSYAVSPACFLSTRSYEQCKVDVAYSNTNVKLIGISGGVSYGALGMSHHSAQDIASMSAIPNMRVYIPSDPLQTEELVKDMLSVSDNTAANTLVKRLGGGNVEKGMETVNSFCTENGYMDTSMGRLMLDLDAESDNYTSVQDCGKFLKDIYQNKLQGSQKMLEDLKAQERTSKIPAGVPSEVETANKTGELDDVENDAAIVYGDSGAYILCVIMNDLQDTARGRDAIKKLSSNVYEYMEKK